MLNIVLCAACRFIEYRDDTRTYRRAWVGERIAAVPDLYAGRRLAAGVASHPHRGGPILDPFGQQ